MTPAEREHLRHLRAAAGDVLALSPELRAACRWAVDWMASEMDSAQRASRRIWHELTPPDLYAQPMLPDMLHDLGGESGHEGGGA